ncbi:MAG: hypothetical protein QW273_03040 [Candidatus Pacearchaeota archaeon]
MGKNKEGDRYQQEISTYLSKINNSIEKVNERYLKRLEKDLLKVKDPTKRKKIVSELSEFITRYYDEENPFKISYEVLLSDISGEIDNEKEEEIYHNVKTGTQMLSSKKVRHCLEKKYEESGLIGKEAIIDALKDIFKVGTKEEVEAAAECISKYSPLFVAGSIAENLKKIAYCGGDVKAAAEVIGKYGNENIALEVSKTLGEVAEKGVDVKAVAEIIGKYDNLKTVGAVGQALEEAAKEGGKELILSVIKCIGKYNEDEKAMEVAEGLKKALTKTNFKDNLIDPKERIKKFLNTNK